MQNVYFCTRGEAIMQNFSQLKKNEYINKYIKKIETEKNNNFLWLFLIG